MLMVLRRYWMYNTLCITLKNVKNNNKKRRSNCAKYSHSIIGLMLWVLS